MKVAFMAYQTGKITREEMHRYQELHKKLIGNDSFVEVEDTPEWMELGKISRKIHNKS